MNSQLRVWSILTFTLLVVSWTPVCAQAVPNVVLIITDDQGYGDLSCHGNPVLKTPHLDRLYEQSVRFTNYHVAPTCSPTRAALLTGHWTNRTGVWHTIMGRSLLRENERTIAEMFHSAGYATGMFGKWHLGDNYPFRPEDRGFSEVLRHGGGGVGQTPDYWNNSYFDGSYFYNSRPRAVSGFCTDVWFAAAREFISTCQEKSQPFFAYISTNAPHGPNHAPVEYSQPYEQHGVQVANFFGMIANVDDNVGRLREFLDERKLLDNTIFIFTTDNGTATGHQVFNAGMRGNKGSEYEGGHRVPLFLSWPTGAWHSGRDVDQLAGHVDLLPTLLDLCGIAPPDDVQFDGRSLRPWLQRDPPADAARQAWPDRVLVTDSQRVRDPQKWRKSAVMTQQWRLINGEQLFAIQDDPAQQHDISSQHPEVVSRLRSFYDRWWNELEPTFSIPCRIYLGHPRDTPATLTAHDWIHNRGIPWNQAQIRDGIAGPEFDGFWHVHVHQTGTYRIELARWPFETLHPLRAGMSAASDVPGVKAYRARPGTPFPIVKARLRIAGQEFSRKIQGSPSTIHFDVSLQAGPGPTAGCLFHGGWD